MFPYASYRLLDLTVPSTLEVATVWPTALKWKNVQANRRMKNQVRAAGTVLIVKERRTSFGLGWRSRSMARSWDNAPRSNTPDEFRFSLAGNYYQEREIAE